MTIFVPPQPIVDFIKEVTTFFEMVPAELADYSDEGGKEISQFLAIYPPETEANQPPPPYYQRGTGMVLADMTLYTSDQLGQKWYWDVIETPDGAELIIKNEAKNRITGEGYGSYVHGDSSEQAPYHAARGWIPLIAVGRAVIGQRGADKSFAGRGVGDLMKSKLAKADMSLKMKWDKIK